MLSEYGDRIRVSIFGESHSKSIGVLIDGIDAGESVDMEKVKLFLERRAPGRNDFSTKRKEDDEPIVLSGIVDGLTTGTPISIIIENNDARSKDYEKFRNLPRPSHADYGAYVKFGKAHDIRGGGHFSGRLTAPLCIAGAICMQILEKKGITIGAHIESINYVFDEPFDYADVSKSELDELSNKQFPVFDDARGKQMIDVIKAAQDEGDSVGGIVECCVLGLPPGVGNHMFSGIENKISQIIFGIPGAKGIEFGLGFKSTQFMGSDHNDEFYYDEGIVKTKTNYSGGVMGGMSNGMPVIFCTVFKPTPSIAKEQMTVDLSKKENASIKIEGRHDPCIVPRAVPCVEAAAAIAILDLLV